ncbi:condensation domain-containing protein [Sphaerisporangium flaviroseum]|uniref:condensation domain-containing protein n=1 Tax=Sphaerisporangium flaviroseum TaxID=509199 RepID=UPI0031F0E607
MERIPLSFNQEFLVMFDRGDGEGPFGSRYNIFYGWRLKGTIDLGTLQEALNDVVARHEALRTLIVADDEGRRQTILPPSPPQLSVRDLSQTPPGERDRRAGELLNEAEAGAYGVQELPLLRAVLGRFDDQDAVLVLIAHHTAVDEWSMRLLMRDLASFYATRRGFQVPELPEVHQYQEFARWQLQNLTGAGGDASREYWREKLQNARVSASVTDHRRSEGLPKTTGWHRFAIDQESTSAILKIARETRSSPFMILLSAYNVLLRDSLGSTDIVVPTFTSGRGQARFHNTVGSFFNFMPLRTDLTGCATFREVVERTRATCMEAYSHDIPFAQVMGEAPALMSPLAEDDRAVCAFQVFRSPFPTGRELAGDLEYTEIPRRLSQSEGGDVPDGALWQLEIDSSGEILGTLGYNRNLFEESTFSTLASEFARVLREGITAPDAPLRQS